MRIDYAKPPIIDPWCLHFVEYFNANGLPTQMSCQGHNDTNMSMYWIEFTNNVTEKEIIDFQLKHLDETGNFASNGRFANRLYVYLADDGFVKPHYSWHYFAATIEAAMADFNQWQKDDLKKGGTYV